MAPESILLVYPLDGRRFGDVYGPYDDSTEAQTDGLSMTVDAPDPIAPPLAFLILPLQPKLADR